MNDLRNKLYGLAALAAASMAFAPSAFAANELSAAFTTDATAAKAEILIIGGLVMGVVAVLFLINKSKSAAR